MNIAVILPAAGLGQRFASALPSKQVPGRSKIEMDLLGRPVFLRAVELFVNRPQVSRIILAVNPQTREEFLCRWGEKLSFMGVTVVAGGIKERWETVQLALEALPAGVTHVAVHDAARPLTDAKTIERVFEAAARYPAVIPGIRAAATLKKIQNIGEPRPSDPLRDLLGSHIVTAAEPIGQVVGGVDRRDVVEVQTPQIFEVGLLRRAYAQIVDGRLPEVRSVSSITDDAMLVEALGETVVVVEGASTNFKITSPQDLELARAWLSWTQASEPAAAARRRLLSDDED